MTAGTRVTPTLRFEQLRSEDQDLLAISRTLLREFESGVGVSLCFENFEGEILTLPGRYAPPSGEFLVLFFREQPAGCGAFRRAEDGACEMKRFFIRLDFRGMGFGRLISEELLRRSLSAGYRKVRLDTLSTMHAAQELYKSMGFLETHRAPGFNGPGVVYMERDL